MSPGKLQLSALAAAAIALPLLTLPSPARADGDVLDRKVDVSLADSAPDQAFQGFARMIGLEAAVEPGLDGKVTVELNNVPCGKALDKVCEMAGCTWKLETEGKGPVLRIAAK